MLTGPVLTGVDRGRDAIMVAMVTPGARWEIEFFADGRVEAERFNTAREITGFEPVEEILREYEKDNNVDGGT